MSSVVLGGEPCFWKRFRQHASRIEQSYLPRRRLHGYGRMYPIDLPGTCLAKANITKSSHKLPTHSLLLSLSRIRHFTDRQTDRRAGLAPCVTLPAPKDQSAAERRAALQQDLFRQCSQDCGWQYPGCELSESWTGPRVRFVPCSQCALATLQTTGIRADAHAAGRSAGIKQFFGIRLA